jgi:hypothetical protein
VASNDDDCESTNDGGAPANDGEEDEDVCELGVGDV